MGMSHKAYAFEWYRFELEFRLCLESALTTNDLSAIEVHIAAHISTIRDPNTGEPLSADWQAHLSNRDIHEFGDRALTRYYDPACDNGIGDVWMSLSDQLPEAAANALLGFTLGPPEQLFDPGRYGSYFQTPAQVKTSRGVLGPFANRDLATFVTFLDQCAAEDKGLYVTF